MHAPYFELAVIAVGKVMIKAHFRACEERLVKAWPRWFSSRMKFQSSLK